MTRHRQAILQCLRQTRLHPTALEVFDCARALTPGITLATVYRNLHALVALGQVREINLGSGATRFDAVVRTHPHITCTRCGRVADFELREPPGLDRRAQAATDWAVEGHLLVFHGICPDCQGQH